jgi:4-hydroxy-tetrahydrodipicolinate synthase
MFTGSLVAIVTPMQADGSLDPEAWGRLLDWHLDAGTAGIVVAGTTGESVTVSDEEIGQLVAQARTRLAGRIPVIAGVGGSSTAQVVERARMLGRSGADALLAVTPAYNRPTQEGLYRHFAAVAEAAGIPVVLYNVPSRTAVDMLPATVARLAKHSGIVAVKEAVASTDRIRELVSACGAGFNVLSGDDATARDAVAAGAQGVISVTANLAPGAMAQMIGAARRGDAVEAARVDAGLAELHKALFVEANPIPVKWALRELGWIRSGIRLPLTELSAEKQPAVRRALEGAHLVAMRARQA